MKFITVAIWSAIFGEILGYIVSQLSEGTYSFTTVAIIAVIVGEIAIIAIPAISGSAASKKIYLANFSNAMWFFCIILFWTCS